MFQICFNWDHFYDPESGIRGYAIALGTSPGSTDVLDYIQLPNHVSLYVPLVQHASSIVLAAFAWTK